MYLDGAIRGPVLTHVKNAPGSKQCTATTSAHHK